MDSGREVLRAFFDHRGMTRPIGAANIIVHDVKSFRSCSFVVAETEEVLIPLPLNLIDYLFLPSYRRVFIFQFD